MTGKDKKMSAIARKTMGLFELLDETSQLKILKSIESMLSKKSLAEEKIINDNEEDEIIIDEVTGGMYLMGTPVLLAPDRSKIPVLGRLKGLVTIPDDFDESLEEMMEYMY